MTVQDAAKMMDDASIGAIVVLEKGILYQEKPTSKEHQKHIS
jgi:hypothetical protein